MASIRNASQWRDHTPLALITGLDETVEFRAPEQSLPSCSLRLDEQGKLTVVINGFIAGEAECPIDLDAAIDELVESLDQDPAVSMEEKIDDVNLLDSLAAKLQAASARLRWEAQRRELEISSDSRGGELTLAD